MSIVDGFFVVLTFAFVLYQQHHLAKTVEGLRDEVDDLRSAVQTQEALTDQCRNE